MKEFSDKDYLVDFETGFFAIVEDTSLSDDRRAGLTVFSVSLYEKENSGCPTKHGAILRVPQEDVAAVLLFLSKDQGVSKNETAFLSSVVRAKLPSKQGFLPLGKATRPIVLGLHGHRPAAYTPDVR